MSKLKFVIKASYNSIQELGKQNCTIERGNILRIRIPEN